MALLHFEDESLDLLPEGQFIGQTDAEGDLTEVQAAIAEVQEESIEAEEIESETESQVEDIQLVDDVTEVAERSLEGETPAVDVGAEEGASAIDAEAEPVVTESVGMSASTARLFNIVLAAKMGSRFVKRSLPKTEAYEGRADQRDATRIATEGVKETLKKAWEWIKQQFKKAWAKIKTWYIKTFDASKRLKAKAEKIRDRANSTSSTIDEKKFTFSQVKTLAVGGKLNSPSDFVKAMERVQELVEKTCEVSSQAGLDSTFDTLEKGIEALTKDNYVFDMASFKFLEGLPVFSQAKIEKKEAEALGLVEAGVSGKRVSRGIADLPGDKHFIYIHQTEGSTVTGGVSKINEILHLSDMGSKLNSVRATFINTKHKPKEISSDAQADTLNNSQIAEICDIVAEVADIIFDYKKAWERVQKHEDRIIKLLDDKFKEITDDIADDDQKNSSDERNARTAGSRITSFVTRMGKVPATVSSYAMTVSSAALSYCVESFAHHKK